MPCKLKLPNLLCPKDRRVGGGKLMIIVDDDNRMCGTVDNDLTFRNKQAAYGVSPINVSCLDDDNV